MVENVDQHLKILEDVLKGITDVIGVYKPDNTIMFYNQAGYEFYNKTFEEIKGKKCYEVLGRNKRCLRCTTEMAIKEKNIVRIEKYIPELKKYMDCCCNPILDELGEVVLVVEQLRDITEKKILENILKESEQEYKDIINLSPDAIVIIVNDEIALANNQALKLYCVCSDELIGEKIQKFIHPEYIDIFNKRINQMINNQINNSLFDYKIINHDKKTIDIEVSSTYLMYQGKPAIQAVIRDITERKESLGKVANIQKKSLQRDFPIPHKAKMNTLYVPAKTVSGDFFQLYKIHENLVVGFLGDVSGKGITAALNISALNVMFNDAILEGSDPVKIIKDLNRKVADYMGEIYIAMCCFSLDFTNNKAKIVGAGINEFSFKDKQNNCEQKIVKGPFLGMFYDSVFDEEIINFNPGDKFYFYSDGLEFVFEDEMLKKKYIYENNVESLNDYLNDILSNAGSIKDDCTLLELQMK